MSTETLPRAGFDLDRPWQLHPQVSVRPERFGALLYHFGTRRLSFLKSPALLTIVSSLGEVPSAREACRLAGVTEAEFEDPVKDAVLTDAVGFASLPAAARLRGQIGRASCRERV